MCHYTACNNEIELSLRLTIHTRQTHNQIQSPTDRSNITCVDVHRPREDTPHQHNRDHPKLGSQEESVIIPRDWNRRKEVLPTPLRPRSEPGD